MGEYTIVFYVIPPVLLLSVAFIIAMLVSLAKQADERRRIILDKACVSTFYITLGILIADVLRNVIFVFVDGQESASLPSFVLLTLLAAVFAVALIVFKRKYGD